MGLDQMIIHVSLMHTWTVYVIDMWGEVGHAIRQSGLSTLWRGLPATLLRDVPFSGSGSPFGDTAPCLSGSQGELGSHGTTPSLPLALYWTLYERCKTRGSIHDLETGQRIFPFWRSFFAGALSGAVGTFNRRLLGIFWHFWARTHPGVNA